MDRRRVAFLVLGVLVLVSPPSFLDHVRWCILAQADRAIVEGRWHLVAIFRVSIN